MNVVHFAWPTSAVTAASGRLDDRGEAVLVAPGNSSGLDDRIFAGHACFSSRIATIVVARPGGSLRYTSHRAIASFAAADLPSRLGPGDRITRSWDGVAFEIIATCREGQALCCELKEIAVQTH